MQHPFSLLRSVFLDFQPQGSNENPKNGGKRNRYYKGGTGRKMFARQDQLFRTKASFVLKNFEYRTHFIIKTGNDPAKRFLYLYYSRF